jgi:bifunctional NMN adenylyltransferase/nudix hydrolase
VKNDAAVGVIIGRYQIPELHEGHLAVLREIESRHEKLLIFLGVSPFPTTKSNPLDFQTRVLMMLEYFPRAIVLPLADVKSDDVWTQQIESGIRLAFPFSSAVLYGSRDSCLSSYRGNWPTCELDSSINTGATIIRKDIARSVLVSAAERRGAIYSTQNRFPSIYPTVDIACLRESKKERGKTQVLMARKPGETSMRFPGGFVDISDNSIEDAAKRELLEETKVTGAGFYAIGSFKVKDWRCREGEAIFTTLFACSHIFGAGEANDDIEFCQWETVEERRFGIEECHVPLWNALVEFVEKVGPKA